MGIQLSSANHIIQEDIKAPVLSFFDLAARDIDNNLFQFQKLKGKKVILVVNVASQSHYAESNFKQLNSFYADFKDKGLEILAFPCDQVNNRQPLSNSEIKNIFQSKYHPQFPIFQKVYINGQQQVHPVYSYLRQKSELYDPQTDKTEIINENFTKFLINSEGKVIKFFDASHDLSNVENQIKKLLS